MNNTTSLTWGAFKEVLLANPDLHLQFQYAEDKWVDAAYHITEIKQTPITSVNCGGVISNWTEIIVQLYEPNGAHQEQAMKVAKALSIINVVDKKLPLDVTATVKIEFGNSQFDTRQMYPNEIVINGGDLLVDLRPDTVQCKAISRGGSCGTTTATNECCAPSTEKPKVELVNLAITAEACCTPGGGCC